MFVRLEASTAGVGLAVSSSDDRNGNSIKDLSSNVQTVVNKPGAHGLGVASKGPYTNQVSHFFLTSCNHCHCSNYQY